MTRPVVVTLALDEVAQAGLDALRRRWFPPERNMLQAHVTLFHALPGGRLPEVLDDVRATAARQPFPVEVTGVRSLGRGTALTLRSPELDDVRARLAATWALWLTPQDRQRFSPHVTVQNKVSPAAASSLLEQLETDFVPWTIRAEGITLWHYAGGPWEPVETVAFTP